MLPTPHSIPHPRNSLSSYFKNKIQNFLLRVTKPYTIWPLPIPLASSPTLPCSYCQHSNHTSLFVLKIYRTFSSPKIFAFAISSVKNVLLLDLIIASPLFQFSFSLNVHSQSGLLQSLNQKQSSSHMLGQQSILISYKAFITSWYSPYLFVHCLCHAYKNVSSITAVNLP